MIRPGHNPYLTTEPLSRYDPLLEALKSKTDGLTLRFEGWMDLWAAAGYAVGCDLEAAYPVFNSEARRLLKDCARQPLSLDDAHDALIEQGAQLVHANETLCIWRARPHSCNTSWMKPLTRRERSVAEWLKQGKANAEIAVILGVSQRTVEKHVENIYAKCGVQSATEFICCVPLP